MVSDDCAKFKKKKIGQAIMPHTDMQSRHADRVTKPKTKIILAKKSIVSKDTKTMCEAMRRM